MALASSTYIARRPRVNPTRLVRRAVFYGLVVRIYNTAFRFYDFSYSATLGVAGFLMAMSIVLVFMAAQKQDEAELGY